MPYFLSHRFHLHATCRSLTKFYSRGPISRNRINYSCMLSGPMKIKEPRTE